VQSTSHEVIQNCLFMPKNFITDDAVTSERTG